MNRVFAAALPALVLAALAMPARADTTVTVSLSDDAGQSPMVDTNGMGMGGDMGKAGMRVLASPAAVPHGPVTFKVTNASHDFVHEMLVVKVTDPSKPLAYDAANAKLNEDQLHSLGEVSELDPGKSGDLTLTLDAGTYALICNQPGHYADGMWTLLTVN